MKFVIILFIIVLLLRVYKSYITGPLVFLFSCTFCEYLSRPQVCSLLKETRFIVRFVIFIYYYYYSNENKSLRKNMLILLLFHMMIGITAKFYFFVFQNLLDR